MAERVSSEKKVKKPPFLNLYLTVYEAVSEKLSYAFEKLSGRSKNPMIIRRSARRSLNPLQNSRRKSFSCVNKSPMFFFSDDSNEYQMTKASKKSIELQTAYVYRTNLPRRHHYSGECS